MNKNSNIKLINLIVRAALALLILAAILAGPLTLPAYGQTPTVNLVVGGEGATPWSIVNIKPGDSGTKTVTLHNDSSWDGIVKIWVSDITEADLNGDGAVLDDYLRFDINCAGLSTNLTLPTRIHQLPQNTDDYRHITIGSLLAGETKTLTWTWSFPETGTPQNEAQGDSLTFSIKYTLFVTEPPPAVPEPATTPEPESAPGPTTEPEPTPPAGKGLGLMVNTIPDTPVVGKQASAKSTSGAELKITGSIITIENQDETSYVNIPVALPESERLESYTDSNGTTFRDKKIVFTSLDANGEPEVNVTINTDDAKGRGDVARAKVNSMFLDILEKKTELVPKDLTNEESAESVQSAHVVNQLSAEVAASINVTLLTVPQNAVIHSTITDTLRPDVQSALALTIVDDNKVVDDIAFVLEVEKTNLPNGTVLGEARITMKVSAEYAQEAGIENFRIYRFDEENRQGEMLETRFEGYDNEGKAVFVGISPRGLSVFVLTVLEPLAQEGAITATETMDIALDILGRVTLVKADTTGRVITTTQATDPDGKIILNLYSGSTILTSEGEVPRRLVITPVQVNLPATGTIVDRIYQIQAYLDDDDKNPRPFTISPSGTLTLTYQESALPANTLLLSLAYYDTRYNWTRLSATAVMLQGELSLNLREAMIFALLAERGTPTIFAPFFRVSNLVVQPAKVAAGEKIIASIITTNIGSIAGTYKLELKLDGAVIDNVSVSLEPGESRIVSFNFVVKDTGIHQVEIAGLKDKVTVTETSNLWRIILVGVCPILIILGYRKKRNDKDNWSTGLKTSDWLVDE